MEVVNTILSIISVFGQGETGYTNYCRNLEEYLNSLRIALDGLRINLWDDVMKRVKSDEARRMMRTNQVRGWLEKIEATQSEVDEILNEGNCSATHKVGKRVFKMLPVVEGLGLSANEFRASTTGLDLIFEKTCRLLLVEDQVGIIGLYGMGGVGKRYMGILK